jgi:hypothetical protein
MDSFSGKYGNEDSPNVLQTAAAVDAGNGAMV